MYKLLVLFLFVGALVLLSTAAFAQDTYYVDHYAFNGTSTADQELRIINVGVNGNPLTVPAGDICSEIYVFDNNQEMVACCGCNITPNGLASAWVHAQLTNNPVTSVVPVSGVIKIALMNNPTGASCDPTAPLAGASTSLGMVFGTHLNATNQSGFAAGTAIVTFSATNFLVVTPPAPAAPQNTVSGTVTVTFNPSVSSFGTVDAINLTIAGHTYLVSEVHYNYNASTKVMVIGVGATLSDLLTTGAGTNDFSLVFNTVNTAGFSLLLYSTSSRSDTSFDASPVTVGLSAPYYFTEAEKLSSPLSAAEESFLPTACSFARYLGSGKGTCSCTNPGL